jgi:hypothetical protein
LPSAATVTLPLLMLHPTVLRRTDAHSHFTFGPAPVFANRIVTGRRQPAKGAFKLVVTIGNPTGIPSIMDRILGNLVCVSAVVSI